MGFDLEKFRSAQYEHRKEAVPVPDLGYMFDGDDKPEWVVRGLTAAELQQCTEASKGQEAASLIMSALMDAALSRNQKEVKIREALGLSTGEVPGEIKKRMEMLVRGSITIENLTLADTALLQERHPIEFMTLTNKIVQLTGQGQVSLGESKPSGEKTV